MSYRITPTGEVYHNGVELMQSHDRFGHRAVFYCGRRRSVARLVAEKFIGPEPTTPWKNVVVHKNFCNWDNRVENLEWMSVSQAVMRDTPPWWELPPLPEARDFDARVRGVRCDGVEFKSITAASKKLKVHRGCISRAVRTGTTHKGISFEYIK